MQKEKENCKGAGSRGGFLCSAANFDLTPSQFSKHVLLTNVCHSAQKLGLKTGRNEDLRLNSYSDQIGVLSDLSATDSV